ncbi:MAG: sulfite reductase [Bacteroidetes bacterium]|nr:MAG: sulfite reductase [Bacteroidota bacterium]
MLAEPKLKTFQELITNASREELIWMNGFLAGLVLGESHGNGVEVAPPGLKVNKISVLFGTETGNSKKLATEFAAKAKKAGVNVKLSGLDQYRLNDLPKEEYLFIVMSTQGDGEPPATAKKFYDHIFQNKLSLNKLKFGVLALGDTSYPLFCKAGEDVDHQLLKLGASRIVPLQKCDTDYTEEANAWFFQVLNVLADGNGNVPVPAASKKHKHKKNYSGIVISNTNLNDTGSGKQTHHIELAIEDGADYEPGDSIGIVPHNKKDIVTNILALAGADGESQIDYKGERISLKQILGNRLNIVHLPERVVKKYSTIVKQEIPDTRIDLLDLLRIYPVKDESQFEKVLEILEPIVPRLYSVSSSPEAHSGEVHITVALDKFNVNAEEKFGLCSEYLSKIEEETELEFYVHKNLQFKLPAPERDVIMIGPGTGIAPFRSFIAQRDATGASGRNWLFFGDQHFTSDFLYQTEIQNWVQTGVLSNVSLAFSRDQQWKVYVQHKMLEHSKEFWSWLSGGAYLYVCGAKEPMSKDVENTLLLIISRQGGKSEADALAYLEQLKDEGRYLKDVY